MVEQSASAAPDKSLQPPNCSGDKISPPNPQIPNLSSPIVSPSASSMDLPQISAPQLGHSQIQITPSGALVFPTKTPAMSQQQTNLMSPTSNFVMQPSLQRSRPMSPIEQRQQQFGTTMEQSASAAPAKSLKPPNCSGDQISPPNHQIPNLSSPIVSPSSTSMDLLQISAPHLQMTPSGILVVPPKMSFGGQKQQQLGSVMARPGMMGPAGQLSMLSSQDAAHLNTQQQHLHQLLQLQQQHHEQQSPHVPGFTISKNLKGSQPSIPASGTISQLICEIQDLVSQAQLHLHNKRLKQVRKALEFQRMESDAANRLEAIQLRDSMEQLSPPAASSHVSLPAELLPSTKNH